MSGHTTNIQVGHGINCLALTAEVYGQPVALVLDPDEAEQLGCRLIQQAGYARACAAEETSDA